MTCVKILFFFSVGLLLSVHTIVQPIDASDQNVKDDGNGGNGLPSNGKLPGSGSACRRIQSTIVVLTTHTPDFAGITGTIKFKALDHFAIQIAFNIAGVTPGTTHGCHIHQFGDLTNICDATGAHFNPNNFPHGTPATPKLKRHVGDIVDELVADRNGIVNQTVTIDFQRFNPNTHDDGDGPIQTPSFCGDNSIVGRTLVFHQLPDDHGTTNVGTSNTTGNAGPRIACGVIGIGSDETAKPQSS